MSELIPYITKPREDTGLTNGKLGMWLFLASEVMLFGGLFSAYVLLRVGAAPEHWHEGAKTLNTWIGTFNTAVLIGSSVSMVMAWASLKLDNLGRARMYMAITIVLALIFLAVKIQFEYMYKFGHHIYPSTDIYYGIYFTITGLHAIHVLGGVIAIAWFLLPGVSLWRSDPEHYTLRIEYVGLYWHFVDLVWIFLFPILYLL
ncbi:MAG: hypothetical protein CMJ18_26040 [Phycisphaeraceae bacterium]|nr:hypothetical protein [Phycisphaeraceae bacterium]